MLLSAALAVALAVALVAAWTAAWTGRAEPAIRASPDPSIGMSATAARMAFARSFAAAWDVGQSGE